MPATEPHEHDVSSAAAPGLTADEARYRSLADAIPVQVWTATPDGALDYVSDRVAEYFQTTPQAILGAGWLLVLHPDDVPRAVERWTSSLQTGTPYEIEFRLWSPSHAEHRWHLARALPFRDISGRIVKWFGSNTDIDDQKRAEAERERLRKEADEANRAKSAFLAALSHELRTPLNAIGGYAQLLEMGIRGPVTDAQRADLARIQRSQQHLLHLIGEVMEFAKLEAGTILFELAPVFLAQSIDDVAGMVAPQMAAKGLQFRPVECATDLVVLADADRLRQVLINLLTNALKFTPGGGEVAVTCGTEGGTVDISVRDTGMGIPSDQLERIFEPFVQLDGARAKGGDGLGLGLALARQMCRRMNGDLTAVSGRGSGSTFIVRLPRSR
ncbi:MAG: PAS domain-containing sensor histidine kinase [Gemmatimonadaceae bacterium]